MKRALFAGVFLTGAAMGAAGLAAAQAAVERQLLESIDVSGSSRQAQLGVAVFPVGGSVSRHTHPGEEIGLVARGALILTLDGQSPKRLRAGETFSVPRGVVHQARAAPGQSVRVVSVWIVDKGQPLAAPA